MKFQRWIQLGVFATMATVLLSTPGAASAKGKSVVWAVKTVGGDYQAIQDAIDAAVPGDTIEVYPGSYHEVATDRSVLGVGSYQFGLFLGEDKAGLTIRGVDAKGKTIHDAAKVQAFVTTDATNNFGYSGIFVEGDDVTLSGLDLGENEAGLNKTIEVIGDGFALFDCVLSDPWGASVYLNDWRFDELNDTSYVKRYRIEGNDFRNSASLDIASGAGYSGPVRDRVIRHNTFTNADFWPSISFNGAAYPAVPWFVYSVGGAVIKDNDFVNTFTGVWYGDDDPFYLETQGHIRARGDYDNDQFDWKSYWHNNKFNVAYVLGVKPPKDVAPYAYGVFTNVRRIGALLQGEEAHLQPGLEILEK